MVNGPQEHSVVSLFKSIYAQRLAQFDNNGKIPATRTRNQYPREAKLAAIKYAKFTWKQTPDKTLLPISKY
jgi:hypothetical protein